MMSEEFIKEKFVYVRFFVAKREIFVKRGTCGFLRTIVRERRQMPAQSM